MKVNISAVHFKTDKELDTFINDKVSKLGSLFNGVIKSEVILKIENNEKVENKIAEIRLEIPGYDLFAKKQCKTFEEATDTAVEALRKQLIRHKEKIKNKKIIK